jgi:hypothetical protein
MVVWSIWGALNGALFAITLTTRGRSHALGELSMPRTALWGALAALALPGALAGIVVLQEGDGAVMWAPAMATLGLAAAAGAGLAAGTLALARRGTVDMPDEERRPEIRQAST